MDPFAEIKRALDDLSNATNLQTAELLAKNISRNAAKLAKIRNDTQTILQLSVDLLALLKSEKNLQQITNKSTRLSESFFRSYRLLRDQFLDVLGKIQMN